MHPSSDGKAGLFQPEEDSQRQPGTRSHARPPELAKYKLVLPMLDQLCLYPLDSLHSGLLSEGEGLGRRTHKRAGVRPCKVAALNSPCGLEARDMQVCIAGVEFGAVTNTLSLWPCKCLAPMILCLGTFGTNPFEKKQPTSLAPHTQKPISWMQNLLLLCLAHLRSVLGLSSPPTPT